MASPFSEGETKVVVSELKRARRRTLTLAWVGLGFFAGLVAWWISTTAKNLPDNPAPVAMATSRREPAAPARSVPSGPRPRAHSGRDEARVWLFLGTEGRVSIDGRPLVKGASDRVDLAPGGHIVTAEIGKAKISKQVQVDAGDELLVMYDEATGRAEVRRLVPFEP